MLVAFWTLSIALGLAMWLNMVMRDNSVVDFLGALPAWVQKCALALLW